MIVRPSARRCRPRRGATVVEFAVVVPIFFALIFGIVDISRGFMVKTLIANAARAGCRTGVLQGKATSDVNAAIDSTLSGQTISGYSKTVQVNGSSGTDVSAAQAGDQISVTVSVPVANVCWLPGTSYLKGPISATFTLVHE